MKKLLLTSTFLLLAASSIAQLFVKPTAGGSSSFVYAKNVQIYVEGTINLEKNPVGDYEGSIYLRDDAQLLQGGTSTYNSGDGLLSVYQTTNADQFDYNFWSSPVGLNAGGTGNTANGPLRLNVSDDDTVLPTDTGIRNFTSAWAGASTTNALTISQAWLYKYLNATADWQYLGGTDGVPAGYGFSMKGTNTTNHNNAYDDPNVQKYDFRGRPNTGDIDINLTAEESTLSGNPYPSALDLALFFYDNTDVEEFYFWDENRSINSHYYIDNQGGYGTWIPLNTTPGEQGTYTEPTFLSYNDDGTPIIGSNNGLGMNYNRRYAPIGQGFMVHAIDAPTTSIATFSNSHRVFQAMDGTTSIFRNVETASTEKSFDNSNFADISSGIIEIDENDGLVPHMRLSAYFPGSHNRAFILAFSDDSTKGYDRGMDAKHPNDATSDVFMPLENGMKTVIQTIPFSKDAIVPLNISADIPGSVVFSAISEVNLPFKKAYLFDAAQSTYQLITQGNTATVNIEEVGLAANRFYIVFKSYDQIIVETAEESGLNLAKETVDVFQDNRLAIMEILNPERFDIKEAAVFDMGGKLVHTEKNIGQQTRYNFPTAIFSDGVYIVKLTTQDNLVLDYKVTIFNKG